MAGLECGKFDLASLPQDELIALEQTIWLKSQVEEKIFIVDDEPHVVVIFSNKVNAGLCPENKGVNKAIAHATQCLITDDSNPSQTGSSDHKARAVTPIASAMSSGADAALGASDLNAMGYEPPPVIPAAAIVPMKSNIRTYGPYASSNFNNSYGGTSIETNPELCPWVFGSTASMNFAGNSLVESKALGLVKAETGAVTIPGLPVAGLSELGAQIGGTGPNLSNMTFTFGSNGVSTSYQFSTYTPKFGSLTNSQIDKIKSVARNRQEQLKFLRSQAILQNKIGRQLQKINNAVNNNKGNANLPANNKNTVHRLLMGEIYPVTYGESTTQNKTVVALGSLEKGSVEMVKEYEKKAYISLDGIFGPVSIKGDGLLPRFTKYEPGCHKASPIQPQPPFSLYEELESGMDQYNLKIDQKHSTPLTNDFGDNEHHHEGPGKGHVIDIVGRESQVPSDGLMTTLYSTESEARYSDDYRFLGLRGPLVLHAWGYDTDGKPIPNAADTLSATSGGVFKDENLKDKFLSNWLQHPSSWPVGPVDLRFDRKRGVWVTPQGYKIVIAKLKETLEPFGSATAKLINENTEKNQTYGPDLWDADGAKVKASEDDDARAFIKIVDRIGLSAEEDEFVYAYYDTFNCEYLVLPMSKGTSVIKFALVQDKNPGDRSVQAIIVDEYGYPLKKDGKTPVTDQNEFNNNIIIVRDPYLNNQDLPPPRGPGQIPGELTLFGPALGSNILQHHINGIILQDGYSSNYKTIGPFIGYALKRVGQSSVYIPGQGQVNAESEPVYEIITLENFARYITGKIGTKSGIFNNGFFLGARAGHRQGVIPVGRGHGSLPNSLNVILRNNLSSFNGTHGFILGDIIDQPVGNGNIINDVDGCRFIASLDNEVSTTTHLVYDIIECERSALVCSWYVKSQDYANNLNEDDIQFGNLQYIEGEFLQGFMWDPAVSLDNYKTTYLVNNGVEKNDLKTGEIIKGSRGSALLTGITVDGELIYTITTKSEIANVAQRYIAGNNPGLFGSSDFDGDRTIDEVSDDFWDGLSPEEIDDGKKPTIDMISGQQWMTYKSGIVVASWDEYGTRLPEFNGEVENCKYKIIYAQEAPVIMTCIAQSKFTPENAKGVALEKALASILPSCQGANSEPIPSILEGKVFNPMGCGAEVGDLVTIQRVYVGSNMATQEAGHPACNYKYIVIQTGKLVD